MRRIVLFFLWIALAAGGFSGCSADSAVQTETTQTVPVTTAAAIQTETTETTEATEGTMPTVQTEPVVITNDYRIALIARDGIAFGWKNLEAGALKAAEELGCEVVNMTPLMDDDELQARQIRASVSDGCHAIVIVPNDSEPVMAALTEAMEAGVVVICVDTSADVEVSAKICMDDMAVGRIAGEKLLAELEAGSIPEGSIGIIAVNADMTFSSQREEGFRQAFAGKAYMLLETEYSQGDAAAAHTIAENYLKQNVAGIFCCGEGCTLGASNAQKQTGSETVIVGFGESEIIRERIAEGHLLASIVPQHESMGSEGVKTACAILNGIAPEEVPADAWISVLTKEIDS